MPPRTRTLLKSKIHRATVTDAALHYVGSITIDPHLLKLADIRVHEKVQIVNISNGARFETYAIEGTPNDGDMCLNGAAARLAERGDLIIVMSYAEYAEEELDSHEPIVVHVDDMNRPTAELVSDTLPANWGDGWSEPKSDDEDDE